MLTTSGTLTISDVDSPATFVAQAGTAGTYGTFAIDAAGAWTYTASSAHNEFVAGTDLHRHLHASPAPTAPPPRSRSTSSAPTTPRCSPSATVDLTETNAALTTSGTLTISDVDSPATFVAQAGTAGALRHLHDRRSAAPGPTPRARPTTSSWRRRPYTDTFAVASADGTTTSVTVNIIGTNDAAVLSSATVDLTETERGAHHRRHADHHRRRQPRHLRRAGRHGRQLRHLRDRPAPAPGPTPPTRRTTSSWPAATLHRHLHASAAADGTTTSVTVNILGTNDAAVLSVGHRRPDRDQRGAHHQRHAHHQRRRQPRHLRRAGRHGR